MGRQKGEYQHLHPNDHVNCSQSTNDAYPTAIMAFNLLKSLRILTNVCRTFANLCVKGIVADRERCRRMVENSIGIVTALNPVLGYERSASVAREALESGASV
jgi:aspartate ammonia-lyase